jgi:negative regulator of sigma E activity
MNCENYQILLSDFVDGTLATEDCATLELHLGSCADCADTRNDLSLIIDFCRGQRGQYDAVPNEGAMWLRISNLIEAEQGSAHRAEAAPETGWLFRLMNRSWQVSLPQLAGIVGAVVVVVALATAIGVRQLSVTGTPPALPNTPEASVADRHRQQQETIAYWNQRVELNKARWSQQMRDTFDRNIGVIDAAVNDSMSQLEVNPHDAVSEDILNDALNDKVALLKEFSDL